jgi:hypothetical protein
VDDLTPKRRQIPASLGQEQDVLHLTHQIAANLGMVS